MLARMHVAAPVLVAFQPPVRGRVLVTESGADLDGNHHVQPSVPNQRYAYDLIGVDAEGRAHLDEGDRVEEWIGWGMPVVASAAGEVVGMVDGARDLAIGETPAEGEHAYGNRAILRHDDGSYTVYAHLQRGSVHGDLLGTRVAAGAELGVVGNSGNSTGPHLHVQRQVGSPDTFGTATGAELAWTGARLVGSYQFDPKAGFTGWQPATTQPAQPYVAHRGDVVEPAGSTTT